MKPSFTIYYLLSPLGWFYGLVTGIRNILYDKGLLKSTSFNLPVINIGNITVGGTGKTPHTEYTASLLLSQYRVAVLSRGYGRHTKGFILSDSHCDSGIIGDEPCQIKERFPNIEVAVCEDRVKGINLITDICHPDVVILDDAFQHRRVSPSLNILLVNYNRNILDDSMLPAGRLRENAKGRSRADIIIVTKCPSDMSSDLTDKLTVRLKTNPAQEVFFTTFTYECPHSIENNSQRLVLSRTPVLAVTGIACPEQMVSELQRQGHETTLMDFADHHRFSKNDIDNIRKRLDKMKPDTVIVTTAKDAARLKDLDLDRELTERIYVLPVSIRFLDRGDRYEQIIKEHIESFQAI